MDQFIFGNKKNVSKPFQDIMALYQLWLQSSRKEISHLYRVIKVERLLFGVKILKLSIDAVSLKVMFIPT